jgi:hypothetical protein
VHACTGCWPHRLLRGVRVLPGRGQQPASRPPAAATHGRRRTRGRPSHARDRTHARSQPASHAHAARRTGRRSAQHRHEPAYLRHTQRTSIVIQRLLLADVAAGAFTVRAADAAFMAACDGDSGAARLQQSAGMEVQMRQPVTLHPPQQHPGPPGDIRLLRRSLERGVVQPELA